MFPYPCLPKNETIDCADFPSFIAMEDFRRNFQQFQESFFSQQFILVQIRNKKIDKFKTTFWCTSKDPLFDGIRDGEDL